MSRPQYIPQKGEAPLYDALVAHAADERASFHTPGHKGAGEIAPLLDPRLDLTELPDTDSLYDSSACILAAEKLAARYFGADRTAFSAGGCTLAIQAMLMCACEKGERVLMDRASHRAAVNACALIGLSPVWLYGSGESGDGLYPLPGASDVERALSSDGGIRAVYISSPDYHGRMCDIEGIARVCRERGAYLLVDNAHGTHLAAFGRHPLALGASMCACSAHKTLPALTSGAFLSSAVPRLSEGMKPAMALFGSTSPSYLVMTSLDLARAWMAREGEERFRRTAVRCAKMRESAKKAGFALPSGDCDPVRLCLLAQSAGMSGTVAARLLRLRGFEPEHADAACVVLLLSPFDDEEQLDRLEDELLWLPEAAKRGDAVGDTPPPISEMLRCAAQSEKAMEVRDAAMARSEWIPVSAAVGRISAASVCPCPPGIPVLAPGERLGEGGAALLETMGIKGLLCVQSAAPANPNSII